MSSDKYHDTILAIITEKGELGVNEIARLSELPLSTVQKYLERQTYFKKTERRKWDLPENVNVDIRTDTMSLMVSSVENALLILKAQLTELQENVHNSLVPVSTLKRGVESLSRPVATRIHDIDQGLLNLDKEIKDIMSAIAKNKDKLPEDIKDLVLNMNLVTISLDYGLNYVRNTFIADISSLILERTDQVSEETLDILGNYQK